MSVPTHDALTAETAAILSRRGGAEAPHHGDQVARAPKTGGGLAPG
jgi:hypothetical protein